MVYSDQFIEYLCALEKNMLFCSVYVYCSVYALNIRTPKHMKQTLKSLKHKYVAKMPSGYLNHPLPVSVLSLCFGEGPKMFHSFWHCFLHLKRIYTSGVLTPEGKKKGKRAHTLDVRF